MKLESFKSKIKLATILNKKKIFFLLRRTNNYDYVVKLILKMNFLLHCGVVKAQRTQYGQITKLKLS